MIYNDPHLQLLHSAFISGDWVYASASRAGVDDYWMRIPLAHLTMPLKGLNFNVWDETGNTIDGRKIPMYQDLISKPVFKFSDSNPLFSVPVDTAKQSSRPGKATIISGTLYSALVQYAGAQEREPGWSANLDDVFLTLRQLSGGIPTGSVRALDYLTYFLLASRQGRNNDDHDGDDDESMETLLWSELEDHPRQIAKEARTNWIRYRYETTRPKSATDPNSLPGSPSHSQGNKDRSPGHSSEVSKPSRKPHSEPRQRRRVNSQEKNNDPISTPSPFGVPPGFAGLTSAKSRSTKKTAQIYGMEIQAISPSSVASSPGSVKSTAAAYDSDNSPQLKMPPVLPFDGPNSVDRGDFKTISVALFNLQRISTQTARRSLKMQTKALATKKMKESAMSAQTKDTIRTTRVLLLPMEGYGDSISSQTISLSPLR